MKLALIICFSNWENTINETSNFENSRWGKLIFAFKKKEKNQENIEKTSYSNLFGNKKNLAKTYASCEFLELGIYGANVVWKLTK